MPSGAAAAQIAHASGESAHLYGAPIPTQTYAIVLAVKDEFALCTMRDRLYAAKIPHVGIVESDAPYSGQLVAIGLKPMLKLEVRKILSSLPLWRGGADAKR